MKILNLFAGIGGNRTLWGDKHEITAVEYDPDIAKIYQERFPNDVVIVGDAMEIFLKEIVNNELMWWSSPCTTHTALTVANFGRYGIHPQSPNLTMLFGPMEIMEKFYNGKLYVSENVASIWWRKELYPQPEVKLGRHLFWSNFSIPQRQFIYNRGPIDKIDLSTLAKHKGIDLEWLKSFKVKSWTRNHDIYRTLLRNMVDAKIGKYILDCVTKVPKQRRLFE